MQAIDELQQGSFSTAARANDRGNLTSWNAECRVPEYPIRSEALARGRERYTGFRECGRDREGPCRVLLDRSVSHVLVRCLRSLILTPGLRDAGQVAGHCLPNVL